MKTKKPIVAARTPPIAARRTGPRLRMLWSRPFTAAARPFQPKDVVAEDESIENAVNIRLTSRQILPTAGKSCRERQNSAAEQEKSCGAHHCTPRASDVEPMDARRMPQRPRGRGRRRGRRRE